jgi:hypothetical protein
MTSAAASPDNDPLTRALPGMPGSSLIVNRLPRSPPSGPVAGAPENGWIE